MASIDDENREPAGHTRARALEDSRTIGENPIAISALM